MNSARLSEFTDPVASRVRLDFKLIPILPLAKASSKRFESIASCQVQILGA